MKPPIQQPKRSVCEPSLRGVFLACSTQDELFDLLSHCSQAELELLDGDWQLTRRDDQIPPPGAWRVWMLLGGRGAGKTRAGAEWVRELALGEMAGTGRIALLGESFAEVRNIMVEGISGILAVHGNEERPVWKPSLNRLEWHNGCVAHAFSADDPESLRGPQFSAAWVDELAKWPRADHSWDMLQFALRLGDNPRQVVTTTPRAVPIIKRLLGEDGVVVSRATTYDNEANLAPTFLKSIVSRYEGTHLGRQELMGELLDDRAGALWNRAALEQLRVESRPELVRVVVAIDPPASSGENADACGIVVAGVTVNGTGYVLEDASVQQASPSKWAHHAVAAFHRHEADRVVAEVNQGGEMVAAVLRQVEPDLPLKMVHARRGKWLRAEPVAALYEQGRVHHLGTFGALEDEMCLFGIDGLPGGKSPDRLDALVWALSELCLSAQKEPGLRAL
ncbi:MAG: ATP-binding protein [Hyphomicrobiales bacterium]|nr:MAG: ATP-binding protein [Hyphomicrobiales bacterium]